MGWAVILAYVCFGVGALLIIIGLVRVTYYGCAVRKDKKERKKIQSYYNFNSHKTDPWLKSNPLVNNRLEVSHVDNDSLKDIDVQRFHKSEADRASLTESQRGIGGPAGSGSPQSSMERDVEHIYYSFPNQGIVLGRETRLDSETLNRNARYEEPNTNLVLAKKHKQQEIIQQNDDMSLTQPRPDLRLRLDTSLGDKHQETTGVVMNGRDPTSARSLDTREALAALDFATAGESVVTPRSEEGIGEDERYYSHQANDVGSVEEHSAGSITTTTGAAVANNSTRSLSQRPEEPLPVRDEMEYTYDHAITTF